MASCTLQVKKDEKAVQKDEKPLIDSAKKICIVLPHPSDKNKGVARVGHPNGVAVNEARAPKQCCKPDRKSIPFGGWMC
jgi:hypothetical protein